MLETSDDKIELERRLEQARRMLKTQLDQVTKERLEKLARDIEEQLK